MTPKNPNELYAEIMEYLSLLQDRYLMLGHVTIDEDPVKAHGFKGIAELIGEVREKTRALVARRFN